ncbi:MAG: dockerin type I repeat-containing protein, partial [Acutalibacteraceae bacterium]|nr:dockerin type I repeat-containing protein [Acutalibacteraceae bacterium]
SYVTWTYFNQPVGTKKTPNQEGSIQIPEANQVLKVGRGGYTPHYSPFDEGFDLMTFPNYLIGFGMGEMDSNGAYSMLNTKNGTFTQKGGCLVSTITFTVQKAGEVEVFTRLDDAIVDLDNGEIHADYVAIYNQKVTEEPTAPPTQPPTESGTAIIHFADDNKRAPMTVKVGDTFTYDIYLKLTDPKVQAFVTWTYFNQPVGTKKTANQEGIIQIPAENQVLKVGRDGYTPHYSPFKEDYDLMKFSNYLIGFGMGAMDSNGNYSMLNTKNGTFTQQGGCLVSTITFTVQKAGEVEVFTRLDDAVVDLDNGEVHADYVAIYNQKVTEEPTQPTAVIHFADDNTREPLTLNVGDTFEYDVYVKLTHPKVQAFVTWTYFNQPVGTKKTANQEGIIQIPEENQVLKVGRNGYTPHYSPFKEDYDLMKFSNYLIGFGMGAMDSNGNYSMLNTNNGTFTQEGGCLVSTITFTVQKAGEVEVFTRLDDAVVDLDNGEIHADYVAIYNQKVTEEPTQPTAVIHFADDNTREPITLNVGDTFEYDIYVKLSHPSVQAFVTWTYFNQPVGTKKTPNQEGNIQIPEENQVLKVGRNGYTPHYSPFDESYDLMKFPNYLIGFGMGEMDANGNYSMLNTKNGIFTQKNGCLVSTITFTVQKAGEVEVFTRLDDAVVDLDNGEVHAKYVAVYNDVHTAEEELVLIGDVDGNGEISLVDLTLIKRYILNKSLIPDDARTKKALDVDKNGSVELIDVVYMTRYILKLNTAGSYTGQTTPL